MTRQTHQSLPGEGQTTLQLIGVGLGAEAVHIGLNPVQVATECFYGVSEKALGGFVELVFGAVENEAGKRELGGRVSWMES